MKKILCLLVITGIMLFNINFICYAQWENPYDPYDPYNPYDPGDPNDPGDPGGPGGPGGFDDGPEVVIQSMGIKVTVNRMGGYIGHFLIETLEGNPDYTYDNNKKIINSNMTQNNSNCKMVFLINGVSAHSK